MNSVKIAGRGTVQIKYAKTDIKLGSPGDMIIRMKACGICGSDLEKVFGEYGMSSGKLGHEPSGEVLSVGKNVKDFKIGDRVFVHHHVGCHNCHFCKHGNFTMCQQYQQSNFQPCGLSDIFLVPEWNVSKGGVLKLPDTMSYEQASLIEPLACCIRAINKVKSYKGDDVAVFGAGPAGLMLVMLAKLHGFDKIFLLDFNSFRLEFSKRNIEGITPVNLKNGFEEIIRSNTENRGVDLSIVATSSLNALSNAFEITRKGGTILQFGVPGKNSSFEFDIAKIYSNELTFLSSYAASEIETHQALNLLQEKTVDLDFLVTHKFKLQDSQNAFDCAHKAADCMKVIITSD